MKMSWIGLLLLCPCAALATYLPPRPLPDLVQDADHVIIGKVTLVDMVDAKGNQVTNLAAHTGSGLPNTIRLHVAVETNGVLLTTAKQAPTTLIIPLWNGWHYSLGQIRDKDEGQTRIFLLKGQNFAPVYVAGFNRDLREQQDIERLLKNKAAGNPPSDRQR